VLGTIFKQTNPASISLLLIPSTFLAAERAKLSYRHHTNTHYKLFSQHSSIFHTTQTSSSIIINTIYCAQAFLSEPTCQQLICTNLVITPSHRLLPLSISPCIITNPLPSLHKFSYLHISILGFLALWGAWLQSISLHFFYNNLLLKNTCLTQRIYASVGSYLCSMGLNSVKESSCDNY
jgi:hypothetical protein